MGKNPSVDRYTTSLTYRNILDMASESGYSSIVFPPAPAQVLFYPFVEIGLATIAHWLETSPYASEVSFLRIKNECF